MKLTVVSPRTTFLGKSLLFAVLVAFSWTSQLIAQIAPPIYYEIEVDLPDANSTELLHESGVDLDHFHPEEGKNTIVIPATEIDLLSATGLSYSITSFDLASDIEQRNIADLAKYDGSANGQEKTTSGFELGSMGGFYTFAEIVQQLDEMASLYPNLITPKFSIGTTAQGRTIWAVKISDNPGVDESASEAAVYVDALHHAREPASMATVINFMFHLLENYNTSAQLGYLVNNREIFFVPCVNPDGYEYNRQTNPNGGGFWRKNRRTNSGSSCVGVDLNRNYDTDWGGGGSSGSTCSDSYRGPSVFSELESQAVRDYVNTIQPSIAYTTHTSGGYWLGPDFSNGQANFAIHAEVNSDCLDENEYIYGDADVLLGYASGTTQNWIYETTGTLTWTPEIGTTGFWPTVPEIIPLVNQQIKAYEYAVWIAGAVADYQGFQVLNNTALNAGQNLELGIEVKNKGLSRTAQNVVVSLTTDNAGVTAVTGSQSYGNLASRTETVNTTPFEFSVGAGVSAGTRVKFYVDVTQEGVLADRDSFYLSVGSRTVLFSDGAESGNGNWTNSGTGTTWQSSDEEAYAGSNCFVDSRLSHTASNNNRAFAMNSSVSLAGTSNPRLEFAAKWGLYFSGTDYVRLQISTNGGSSWSNIATPAMETIGGQPAFVENERWTFQSSDLSAYVGQSIRFRFVSISTGGLRPDGFYFDDFRIVDYSAPPVCSVTGGIVSESCDGMNTVATGDDSYTITVSATVANGSGAYDVLVNGTQAVGNVNSGSSVNIILAASGNTAAITFRDAADNGCVSGVSTTNTLSSCSPTCSDGIQNGNETGIDCGGPDCADCTSCSDGIQNGNETGVDCGGPNCPACPTCDDGIQNGNETGVDCGGPDCATCPTCDDGVQNGNETGVDCGGPDCAACPTCDDGIQNGNETGVDCGGPDCAACPTCDDGIQNGDETGVDCGGSCPNVCTGCTPVTIISDGFEAGYGNWIDGGSDCARVNNTTYAFTGVISLRLRDNSSSSTATTNSLDLSSYTDIEVDFTYVPVSMDNATEDFFLEVSTNGGGSYTIVEEWNRGDEFENNIRYFENVVIPGPFTSNTRLRFRCDASGNSDWVYIDDIVVSTCQGGGNPPNCNDGVQNGNETGVDCGGPDCAACETCNDGIQNGNETGVDCGGPDCAACPTCNDGIQNGNETGVDCGGPDCAACETCNDGVQNGNETDVDCGGPDCAACPTCSDGVQNGNETGVDCGGPDCAACPVSYCNSSSSNTTYEYIQSVTFNGQSNTSGAGSGYSDFTGAVSFSAQPSSTVNISLNPGFQGTSYNEYWSVYIDYNVDGDFDDAGELAYQSAGSTTQNGTITIPAGATLGTTRMRVQMQWNAYASSSCQSFTYGEVEDYSLTISSTARLTGEGDLTTFGKTVTRPNWSLFPNPARETIMLRMAGNPAELETTSVSVMTIDGRIVQQIGSEAIFNDNQLEINLRDLRPGVYFVVVKTAEAQESLRFVRTP